MEKSKTEEVKNQPEITGARLLQYIEKIERLEEEKKAIAEDIADTYSESKGAGLDTKIIRKIVRERKVNLEKRREEEELLELYKSAINME